MSAGGDPHLIERLNAALDRLEITLDSYGDRLREADASAAVADAMTQDRAQLAAALDAARARADALERAAVDAEADIAEAAAAVRAVLEGEEETPGG